MGQEDSFYSGIYLAITKPPDKTVILVHYYSGHVRLNNENVHWQTLRMDGWKILRTYELFFDGSIKPYSGPPEIVEMRGVT